MNYSTELIELLSNASTKVEKLYKKLERINKDIITNNENFDKITGVDDWVGFKDWVNNAGVCLLYKKTILVLIEENKKLEGTGFELDKNRLFFKGMILMKIIRQERGIYRNYFLEEDFIKNIFFKVEDSKISGRFFLKELKSEELFKLVESTIQELSSKTNPIRKAFNKILVNEYKIDPQILNNLHNEKEQTEDQIKIAEKELDSVIEKYFKKIY